MHQRGNNVLPTAEELKEFGDRLSGEHHGSHTRKQVKTACKSERALTMNPPDNNGEQLCRVTFVIHTIVVATSAHAERS